MAKRPPAPEPSAKRKAKGFVPTSGLIQAQLRRAGESRGFAVSRLLTHWVEVVGEDIAQMARPVKVSYGRQGFGATLTVLTTGARAPMLEMQKERIRDRVNACYGYSAISVVRITQTAPTGFSEGQVSFETRPARSDTPASPQVVEAAQGLARDVGSDDLRKALERLGRNVLSRHKS
ncbi:MAG: DUF721 domain-containing protein [Brevirhabdus sp.]